MKVLLIAKTLSKGGAASGALNLIHALRSAGADVTALDAGVCMKGHPMTLLRNLERVCERIFYGGETHFLRLGPPVFDLIKLYDRYKPDVIQLCDVSGNIIRFSDIDKVGCTVVHRMSDFWPYNGAHHYSEFFPEKLDFADIMLRKLIFDSSVMPSWRVAPSQWLANLVDGKNIKVIRNAVVLPSVEPRVDLMRSKLRFGFISAQVMDVRKGFMALPRLLEHFSRKTQRDIELHVFGRKPKNGIPSIKGVYTKCHGVYSRDSLEHVYECFDILLCPSAQDNSPNVLTEALAHGVPVIAQIGTGMDSYIKKDTGALIDFRAVEGDVNMEFSDAVRDVVSDYVNFSAKARLYAATELCPKFIGEQYFKLYSIFNVAVADDIVNCENHWH